MELRGKGKIMRTFVIGVSLFSLPPGGSSLESAISPYLPPEGSVNHPTDVLQPSYIMTRAMGRGFPPA